MNKILPVLGGIISKNKEAYRYLPNSIDEFLTTENLCKELKNAGLEANIHKSIFYENISHIL
jgi:demethylmenaquinone methyltransferase/2-methoxy-6-polyprenyl-1,4-benzoquinol methylase